MIVYSAACGYGGKPVAPRPGVHCFTEDEGERVFTRAVMEAKRFKLLPHLFFPQHDISVWLDHNIALACDADDLVDRVLGEKYDVALFRHPYRQTVWQEIEALKIDPRFRIPYLQRQLARQEQAYSAVGLPDATPLFECNFLVRRHNKATNRLMDAWWSEVCRWQWRDQVSFPYVLWRHGAGVRVNRIEGVNIRDHSDFRYDKVH